MSTLVLDATTKTITAVMSGAAATNNPEFTAAWADSSSSGLTEGASDGALNGTSLVTLVAAPAASTRRVIKWITIQNKDTAPVTVTISYANSSGSTSRQIAKVTLAVNDTWTTDGTFDSAGNLKTALTGANLGTVTTVSVVSANGFAGTVATATTTPAITLSTSITGVLKGNGTAISAATAGTDYVAPGTATTFTATQTFTGASSTLGSVLQNAAEVCTVSATAATGTINYDVTTQNVLYYTTNASANWTVNFRGSSGTSLNTLMSTGQVLTVTFLVAQGSTAYYNSAVQVDGASVTPKYQGGTAWSSGNASGVDAYVYAIVKTGSAAFTIFASQTRFA